MLERGEYVFFYDNIKNDLPNVLKRAEDLGVDRFICVATNVEDAKECLDLTKAYDNIYGSAGIHPHDSKDAPEDYAVSYTHLTLPTKA